MKSLCCFFIALSCFYCQKTKAQSEEYLIYHKWDYEWDSTGIAITFEKADSLCILMSNLFFDTTHSFTVEEVITYIRCVNSGCEIPDVFLTYGDKMEESNNFFYQKKREELDSVFYQKRRKEFDDICHFRINQFWELLDMESNEYLHLPYSAKYNIVLLVNKTVPMFIHTNMDIFNNSMYKILYKKSDIGKFKKFYGLGLGY